MVLNGIFSESAYDFVLTKFQVSSVFLTRFKHGGKSSHPIKLQDSSIFLKGIHGYPSWKYLPRERTIWDYYFWLGVGNSMSNHPGHDTLTSQILLIFSLVVDNVETINPWKFQTSTSYGSKVIKIWKFDRNGCSSLNLRFL